MAVCGREVVEESFESGLDGGPSCDVHLLLARGRGYLYFGQIMVSLLVS